MATLKIGWLNKCRCGNKSLSVKTERGSETALWDDDAVKCNSCGREGIVQVCEGQAQVFWETEAEMNEGKPMTLTKKQLIERAREISEEMTPRIYEGGSATAAIDSRLAEIALAALKAEPVAWIWRWSDDEEGFWRYSEERKETNGSVKAKPLFTAPPAPVVPDELLSAMEEVLRISDRDHDAWHKAKAGVSSCRAAMLQGAEPVTTACKLPTESAREKALVIQLLSVIVDLGLPENCPFVDVLNEIYRLKSNSPAIPDSWVACSERMPEGMKTVITSNGFDIGQAWWDGEGWNSFDCHDVVPGAVTHWMPMPAAPQQEVK